MNAESIDTRLDFFVQGGEMGMLTRAKDWSATPVGPVETWPQSLRTTVSIILNSKFPMFLWWGPELICFYNDAYRPSLGKSGKHPYILGMPAEEAWLEIWEIIKPLIDRVLAGGDSTWSEDQLIPIYRNGKLEDVYWTFSYSPVKDESGKVAGVLVICTETTQKITVLKEIKEREDQLRFTLDAAELGTWDFNPATYKFTGNHRMKDWFGISADDDIKLSTAMRSIVDRDRQRVADAIAYALTPASGGNYEIKYSVINAVNKKERKVLVKGKAVFNDANIATRFSGIMQDISDEEIVLKKVEKAEERLRLATEATSLATWELDLQTNAILYSPRLAEIFGHSPSAQFTWEELRTQLHPDDTATIVRDAFEFAKLSGKLSYESRIIMPQTAEVKWVRIQGQMFFDENKNPVKTVGTLRDITDERNQQQALIESEKKFRLLADSMPQFIWTGDAQGNLNYFNQSVYKYSGLSPEEIDKNGWIQIVHDEEREDNIREWQRSIQSGEDFIFEHRFRRYDGEYRWQLSRAIPQRDEAGNIQMWVGTSTDIQDQKTFARNLEAQVRERTRELKEKNRELEKMNAELESFAYVSSHDLQEPLRKILTFSSRITESEYAVLSKSGKEYFTRMQNAAKRMQTLIDDLLAYSRTNTSERKFELSELNTIVEQVKSELKDEIQHKDAVIEVSNLCEIRIIPFQFRQLMHNLIGNSLKFSRAGVQPHITITGSNEIGERLNNEALAPQRKYCHIIVADNGIGFDNQYNTRIFEVFQRLYGKDEYNGTGIGLAIVKKIVENHDGVVTATGELNKGARFDIYIPNQG